MAPPADSVSPGLDSTAAHPAVPSPKGGGIALGIAMLSMYFIWGSSYISIKIGLEGFPPFLLTGVRFYTSGSILFIICLFSGYTVPRPIEWFNGALIGFLLLTMASTAVGIAEGTVSSGLVAIGFATIPLYTALILGFFGKWPRPLEWLALLVGIAGIGLLNLEGEFRASPFGATVVMLGSASWSLGTVLTLRMRMPPGFMATAVEMITAGLTTLAIGLLLGERIAVFPAYRPSMAMLYMIVFPSMIAFSAHRYLLDRVRPIVANSFAYTNPIIAVFLGILLGGESISAFGLGAMAIVILSLLMLAWFREEV